MCIYFYQIRITAGVYVVELYVEHNWRGWRDGIICGAMATSVEAHRIVHSIHVQRYQYHLRDAICLCTFR